MEHLQFPIGRFLPQPDYTTAHIEHFIAILESAPVTLQEQLATLSQADLAKTYRAGGWNIRQLVHHIADIHLLNFLRLKKTLTEPDYVGTLIEQTEWADTPDATQAPIDSSVMMFTGINQRFVFLLKSLDESAFNKSYYHPKRQLQLTVKQSLYMATWHIRHHQAHIALALEKQTSAFLLDAKP